ncbi:MAG: porin family protein [Ignavibacteriaceae bacterium]|nr:porin family protein [Ignavibacteriaceae bacterium]
MKRKLLIALCFLALTITSFAQYGYGTELNGNILVPVGKNADDYNIGFGALVGFYYDITENFRMALVLGYLRIGINENKINGDFTSGGEQGNVNVSGGVGVIPAILSLRLVSPGPGMRIYGLVEGGLYSYNTSISGTYTIGSQVTQINESEFRSEAGFAFGGGVLFPLQEQLSLDVNVRYNWINDSEYSNVTTTNGTSLANSRYLSLGVGVNWFFPLKKL